MSDWLNLKRAVVSLECNAAHVWLRNKMYPKTGAEDNATLLGRVRASLEDLEHLARRFHNTDVDYLLTGVCQLLLDSNGSASPEPKSGAPACLEGTDLVATGMEACDIRELFFGGQCWPELKQGLAALQVLLLRVERAVGSDFDFSKVCDPVLDAWLTDLGQISDGFWENSFNPFEPGPVGFFLHRRRVFERLDVFLQKIQLRHQGWGAFLPKALRLWAGDKSNKHDKLWPFNVIV